MSFDILTKEEAAHRARISPSYMHQLIRNGKGPTVTQIGRRVLVRTDALQAWLESCSASAQQAA